MEKCGNRKWARTHECDEENFGKHPFFSLYGLKSIQYIDVVAVVVVNAIVLFQYWLRLTHFTRSRTTFNKSRIQIQSMGQHRERDRKKVAHGKWVRCEASRKASKIKTLQHISSNQQSGKKTLTTSMERNTKPNIQSVKYLPFSLWRLLQFHFAAKFNHLKFLSFFQSPLRWIHIDVLCSIEFRSHRYEPHRGW